MNLGLITHLQEKLASHRARALRDAVTREQRTQVLQIIQNTYPPQADMKARQTAVDTATDEVMQVFESYTINYHHDLPEKRDA